MQYNRSRVRALMRLTAGVAVMLVIAGSLLETARAQSSSSYAIDAKSINAGGNPANGTVLQSSSFRISLDAIGEPIASLNHASGSFSVRGGTGAAYRPPGEVNGVSFTSKTVVAWTAHASAGTYNVYRGAIQNYVGSGFGSCVGSSIELPTASDTDAVPSGGGFFYLMTVANVLAEEGTKGFRTGGLERSNLAPCP